MATSLLFAGGTFNAYANDDDTADSTPEATESAEPTATPEATDSTEPTASAESTPEATESADPTATPEATESAEPTATPEATESAEPTATPEATESAEPTATPEATESTPEATDETGDDEDTPISLYEFDEPVAKIGETTFTSLNDAVDAAKDGETIDLLVSVTTDGLDLYKNIVIDGGESTKYTVTFSNAGIALHGVGLAFNNTNVKFEGIGATPYAEWNWVTICASNNSTITLNNSTMTMDGADAGNAHAIYFTGNNHLNLINSELTIKNYVQDAIEWDGKGSYNVNMTGSTYISDNNRQGFTGTFHVTIDNSNVQVINSTGSGSNGAYYTIRNKSNVEFNNNRYWGISAWRIDMSDNSTLTANDNGYSGIWTRVLNVDGTSTLDVERNGNNADNATQNAGIRFFGNGTYTSTIEDGADVTIVDNFGSGIYASQSVCNLTIATNALITGNGIGTVGEYNGLGATYGGGVYNLGTMVLSDKVQIYNNHASNAGDDIYSTNAITFGAVTEGVNLDGTADTNDCLQLMVGWYDDSEDSRWTNHSVDAFHVEKAEGGSYSGTVAYKAAHGYTEENAEVSFTKIDSSQTKLVGASFGVYSDEKCTELVTTVTSDEEGVVTITDIPANITYYVKETVAPSGYNLNKTVYTLSSGDAELVLEDGEVVIRPDAEMYLQIDEKTKKIISTVKDPKITTVDLDPSNSKTATNLDENFESDVTLSLPAEDYKGDIDVAFVLDGSTSSDESNLAAQASALIAELATYENLNVKVSVTIFGGFVPILDDTDLLNISDSSNLSTLQTMIENKSYDGMTGRSGSNLQAGVVTATSKLDEDVDVEDENKYLVILSDGAARMWYQDGSQAVSQAYYANGTSLFWNSNEDWRHRYGVEDTTIFRDFSQVWAAGQNGVDIGAYAMTKAEYDVAIASGTLDANAASWDEVADLTNDYYTTYEAATYFAAQSIISASNKYSVTMVTYPYHNDENNYGQYIESFRAYLADNGYVTRYDADSTTASAIFSSIKNDLIQVVDAGSKVTDVIGYGTDNEGNSYDFDFVDALANLTLTVNGTAYDKATIDAGSDANATSSYAFGSGKATNGEDYAFEVWYYENGTDGASDECFVWKINRPVTKDEPVELTYTVVLTNPSAVAGTYGTYDRDGSNGGTSLLTNISATLDYVSSNGKTGSVAFPKPTVSYKVNPTPTPTTTPTATPTNGTTIVVETPGPQYHSCQDVGYSSDYEWSDAANACVLKAKTTVPNTSDDTNLTVWLVVTVGALAVAVFSAFKLRFSK